MDKNEFDTIKHMSETLVGLLTTASILSSLLMKISEIITTIITILGIVGVIEIIKNWIK